MRRGIGVRVQREDARTVNNAVRIAALLALAGWVATAVAAPAERVVSLAPHLTELVYAAGGGARLVGVGRHSDHPSDAARLPVVSDAFSMNFEAIVKLKPDLVLVWGSGTNERHKAQLRNLGLEVLEIEIGTVADIAAVLRRLGERLGTPQEADAAARTVEQQWQRLRATYAQRKPVRVFWQLWHEPLMTVNRRHILSEAITACGGINVFADLAVLTPTVSWEAAVRANPQLIATAGSKEEVPDLGRWASFKNVEAVRHKRFVQLNGDLLGRMGPRFVQGAQALCEAVDRAR
jgi:iron complex transport system substrate-binding protein